MVDDFTQKYSINDTNRLKYAPGAAPKEHISDDKIAKKVKKVIKKGVKDANIQALFD